MYKLNAQSDGSLTTHDLWLAEEKSSYKLFLQSVPANTDYININNYNGFKGLQWTPDNSCILTVGEDGGLRLYVCPADILEAREVQTLRPIARRFFLPRISASCPHPQFSLSESRCLAAVASTNCPVRLYNIIDPNSTALCSYSVQNRWTEEYGTVFDMHFNHSGTALAIGSKGRLTIFHVDHPTDVPFGEVPVGKKIVSSLAFSADDQLLATGRFNGSCTVYDVRSGNNIAEQKHDSNSRGKDDTTQLLWNQQDNHYLFQIHRRDGVSILDTRKNLQTVQTLDTGLDTNLRIRGDCYDATFMLGTDKGMARIWTDPIKCTEYKEFPLHNYPLTAISANPLAGMQLLATCCNRDIEHEDRKGDSCLKLWIRGH